MDVAAVKTEEGRIIINCAGWSDSRRDMEEMRDEQRANATICAAAPDLYEALEMVRDADNDRIADHGTGMPSIARAKIDAAMAKARGEQ